MKKQFCFSVLFLAILLFACEPPVTFDKPQPPDVKSLAGFPRRLQGNFLSMDDSTVVQITANSLIRFYEFDQKMHLSQLDSTKQLIGDTLFDTSTNKGIPVRIEGDSLILHVTEADTLFHIDQLNVLKKYKGYYFINTFNPFVKQGGWEVKKIQLSRGSLTISGVNTKADIDQLKTLTESTQDTTPYVFSPSRQEFKKFVRNEGFRDVEEFRKIRE